MLNAMNKAITGLRNFQRSIEVVGNNLSNVNTPGYRAKRVLFREVAGAQPGGPGLSNLGGGAALGSVDTLLNPGEMIATGVATDMAIQGGGYFVVGRGTVVRYTRDGSFELDSDGYLVSRAGGLRLKGYGARAGAIDLAAGLTDLRVPLGQASRARASEALKLTGNLDAAASAYVPPSGGQPEKGGVARVRTSLLDSLGRSHDVTLVFKSLGGRAWSWEVQPTGTDTVEAATGTIQFDAEGKASTTEASFVFHPDGEAGEGKPVKLDLGALAQLVGATTVNAQQAGGFPPGELQSFSLDGDGVVTGIFSSGLRETLGRVALATFRSPGALANLGEGLLGATAESGSASLAPAGAAGPGALVSGSLEGSNVDVSAELTRMVLTQRAFQSNSRLIRAADEMWQDLLDLGR